MEVDKKFKRIQLRCCCCCWLEDRFYTTVGEKMAYACERRCAEDNNFAACANLKKRHFLLLSIEEIQNPHEKVSFIRHEFVKSIEMQKSPIHVNLSEIIESHRWTHHARVSTRV